MKGLALALGLISAACGGGRGEDRGTQAQALGGVLLKWSVPNAAAPFVEVASKSDGSVLATTREDVVRISPTGVKTVVYDGLPDTGRPRVAEGVDGFFVSHAGQYRVYDAAGVQKASVAIAGTDYPRLVPGTLSTFWARTGSGDPESPRVIQGRFVNASGAVTASFAATDLTHSRVGKTHVVWATPTAVTKTSFAGATAWTKSTAVHAFEIDDAAKFWLANRSGDTRVVELFDGTASIGASTFESPVWNLSVAPLGQWAAANSKGVARLFKAGKVNAQIQLGDVFPVSLDVSDGGYVLLGLQSRKNKNCLVKLYDSAGTEKWSKTLAEDANGYRPEVRFTPDGKGFSVREQAALSLYTLVSP